MNRSVTAAVISLFLLPATRAEEPKPLPPELRWVPADSVGFVHVRVGEIWKSRAGKAALTFLNSVDPRTTKELERKFGVPLADIDRVTLVMPDIEADSQRPGVVLRVTTREPYDRARLVAAMGLADRPDLPKGLGGGKKLFARGYGQEFVHLTDAKTVTHFYGDGAAALLGKLLEGETSGRLSPALEAAAAGDPLVAAIDMNRLRSLPGGALPEEFGPLLEAGVALLRGKLTADGADLDLRATFSNEPHARTARQTLAKLQDELLRDFGGSLKRAHSEDDPTQKLFMELIFNTIKNARFEFDGGVVTGATAVDAKAFVEFMEKDGGRTAASSGERRMSENNLKQITLAMHNYESANGVLPMQSIKDRNGKPLLSWRVTILPYVEEDALYKEFHLDEPWDSEHNKKLIARMPRVYRVPGKKFNDLNKTAYLVPVGPNTVFPADAKRAESLGRISVADGVSNTIFVIQANDDSAVIWSKPDDLVIDEKDPLKGVRRTPAEAFLVAMGDGATRVISPRINPRQILRGTGWRDGEFFDFNDLTGAGK